MNGWYRSECDWWPSIAEGLRKPWPPEAALNDLRWHADRARQTGEPMPGRRYFRDRWGWKDWPTRKLCKDESAWMDPRWTASSHDSPKALPETSRKSPATLPPRDGQTSTIGENPPAILPESSQSPPRSLHRRVETQTQTQDTVEPPNPLSADASKGAPHLSLVPVEDDPPAKPKRKRRRRGEVSVTPAIQRVWDCWAGQKLVHPRANRKVGSDAHPGAGDTPPQPVAKVVANALDDYAAEDLVLVVDWAHASPDHRATKLRQDGFLGLDNLCRPSLLPGKLDAARQWHADDRPTSAADGPGQDFTSEGQLAFDKVLQALKRRGVREAANQPFSEHPERDAAVREVLKSIPLRSIGTADDFGLRQLRNRFAVEYARCRAGP